MKNLKKYIRGTPEHLNARLWKEKQQRDHDTRIRLESYAFEYCETPECRCYNPKALNILRDHFKNYYENLKL